ncbi:MAG: sensor histidine kinase [Rubrivivax sp.]
MRAAELQLSPPAEAQYAAAFERGRCAERVRLAQDLHDDIGARLLTLMVRARDPAIVDSLRETLRDLKVLTRGLAGPARMLADAAAEWRQDLGQRLEEAGAVLRWSFDGRDDLPLSIEQWAALTRVLRELVTNIVAHAEAGEVRVEARLQEGWLALQVDDDGRGRAPQAWAQGLGVGGVRRRVAELGGSVRWSERTPRGIRCEVRVPLWPSATVPSPGGVSGHRANGSAQAPVSS